MRLEVKDSSHRTSQWGLGSPGASTGHSFKGLDSASRRGRVTADGDNRDKGKVFISSQEEQPQHF